MRLAARTVVVASGQGIIDALGDASSGDEAEDDGTTAGGYVMAVRFCGGQ
jgi:hypothetical protein